MNIIIALLIILGSNICIWTNKNFKQTSTLEHQQGWSLVQPFVVDPENCRGKSWAGGALWHCGVLRSGRSDKQMWNLTTNKYVWCCFGFLWVWAPGDIQDVHPHQDGQGRPRTKKIKYRVFSIPSNFHQWPITTLRLVKRSKLSPFSPLSVDYLWKFEFDEILLKPYPFNWIKRNQMQILRRE